MDMEHFLTSVYLAKIHYLQIDCIYMYQEARLQQNYKYHDNEKQQRLNPVYDPVHSTTSASQPIETT